MLAPFPAVVIKGDLRRITNQLGQRFDRTAYTIGPVSRQHPMRERVAA